MQSIAQDYYPIQAASKDGSQLMNRKCLISYVQELIRDKVDLSDFNCSIHFLDLNPTEKKTLFFYCLDSFSDFEWFCQNPTRLEAGFKEYQHLMQSILDENVHVAFSEYMSDKGASCTHYHDNGEARWN
jgi:hypothetical protein